MLKMTSWLAGAAVLLTLSHAPTAQAADVYVVHGINGTDLGLPEDLPVDVKVDDGCVEPLEGLTFKQTPGPVELPAPASYQIRVFLAFDPEGGAEPAACEGLEVINTNVELLFGQTAVIVAHLNDSGQPKASIFNANLADLSPKQARVSVHHTAAAPAVDVIIKPGRRFKDAAFIKNLTNSEQAVRTVRAGPAQIKVKPQGNIFKDLFRTNATLEGEVNTLIFAVGTLANGTFDVIVLPLTVGATS